MPKSEVPRLAYSFFEAAAALNISVNTLRRAGNAGLIRVIPMGRMLRVPTAEVERLAAEGLPSVPRWKPKSRKPTKLGRPPRANRRKAEAERRAAP